jgi:hypothetical protein
LFSAASDVIVSDFIELLLIFSVDGFSFSKQHGIWGYDAKIFWFSSNNFELNWLEISSDDKEITLLYWSVCILEIRNQIGFGEITCDSLNSVLKWKNVDFGEIRDFSCRSDLDNVA